MGRGARRRLTRPPGAGTGGRSAGGPRAHAAQRLQELHRTTVLALVAEVVAADARGLRAALIGAQLSGLVLTRYLLQVTAVAEANLGVLIAAVAPAIDQYLTGDLTGAR